MSSRGLVGIFSLVSFRQKLSSHDKKEALEYFLILSKQYTSGYSQ